MVSVLVCKLLALGLLFILSLLFSLLPIKLIQLTTHTANNTRRHRLQAFLSLLSCFSAGVFLATCLLDLFPDVQEKLNAGLHASGVLTSFPVSEFVVVIGLFLIIFLEQLVLTCQHGSHGGHGHSHGYTPVNTDEPRDPHGHENDHGGDVYNDIQNFGQDAHRRNSITSASDILTSSTESHFSTSNVQERSNNSMLRSIVLLIALSFHSVFEGVAVGLQDNVTSVLRICAALSVHKFILAFSLGLSFTRNGRMSLAAILRACLVFCAMSPLGIGIGIGVTDLTEGNKRVTLLVNGTMLGIACGTFLYVVFFEIVPREFVSEGDTESGSDFFAGKATGMLKVFVMVIGFVTVGLVIFLSPTEVPSDVQPVTQPP